MCEELVAGLVTMLVGLAEQVEPETVSDHVELSRAGQA